MQYSMIIENKIYMFILKGTKTFEKHKSLIGVKLNKLDSKEISST